MGRLLDEDDVIDALMEQFKRNTPIAIRAKLTVEALPSAQPETHGKRTKTHACDCVRRQDAIDAMANTLWHYPNECYRNLNEYEFAKSLAELGLKSVPSAQPENDWIPCTKKAHPDTPFRVQVQLDNGWIITAYYQDGEWLSVPDCDEPLLDKWIEAWRELPEPYQEGEQDEH